MLLNDKGKPSNQQEQEPTMSDATVTLVGNLTRDPELRFTTSGAGTASSGMAVNRRYQVNGEWQEKVSFFNIVAWNQLAENFAASASKGTRVIVTGRLEQREYETKEGEKRSVVEVVADEIGLALRFATASAERNESSGAAPQKASKAPRRQAALDDEEPF